MLEYLSLFIFATPVFCTVIQPCDVGPPPVFVQADDCVDDCNFLVGDNVTHYAFFVPDRTISTLTAVQRLNSTVVLNDWDGCDDPLIGSCPFPAGRMAAVTFSVQVTESLVGFVSGQFELRDQNSDLVSCYMFSGTVTQPE